jgi:proteasome alpha subunit
MQGRNQQQAYDRGSTIFSPDGRLYQVEYAREAVKRGSPSVGVRTSDGVVLAVRKGSRSPLVERSSVEKLHKIDDHLAVASAGHVADARQLVDFARQQAQVERLRYDEPIGVETLTKEITDRIQEYTQAGGARPFGVALVIGGVAEGEPCLYETDPSGTPYEWKALSIGAESGDIREYLEANYDPEGDLEGGIELALGALASVAEEGIDGADVGLTTITTAEDGTGQFRELGAEEIGSYLEEFDIGAADEGEEEDE